MNAKKWFDKGQLIEVNGRILFVIDTENNRYTKRNINSTSKPVLVILHGYPTCSFDYYKALPYLEKYFRVIMHDHLGFGYSDKPKNYSYSLFEQADFALSLWQQFGIKQAHIVAHDYGTSVATEILARDNENILKPFKINSLTLCNGSMHIELAQLRTIQKLLLNLFTGPVIARLSNKKTLARNLKNIYFDASNIDQEEINALWTMMTYNNGRSVLHKTTQYIKQRYTYWDRWIGALKTTELPISIVWAKDDPVAVLKIAETIYEETKNSELILLDDLGHFPMLEKPNRWVQAVIQGISKVYSTSSL
jgi:pimeloyl-ACP methyl ester carboxylesterase